MGRITEAKGIAIARDIAKFRPDLKVVVAGQGDPGPWCTELNMEYIGPIHGKARAKWIGEAKAVLAPSKYLEPFGGIAVEAMLCGTPVIATPWGAFTETIEHGKTGFRCRTMPEFLRAVDVSSALDRHYIASYARSKWDTSVIGPQYATAFDMIYDLHNGGGWYSFPGDGR
jgi:glycosyltransferase involved in cell wall biosynthesis